MQLLLRVFVRFYFVLRKGLIPVSRSRSEKLASGLNANGITDEALTPCLSFLSGESAAKALNRRELESRLVNPLHISS